MALLAAAPIVAAPTASNGPVATYQLEAGVVARLLADGTVVLDLPDTAGREPLLQARWPRSGPQRIDLPPAFTASAREGDPGGRRGFSRQPDDDGDGLEDEDPLDGRDNDGDGLIDEDHAAVSHLMGIWDQTIGERGRRLETYHWTYPHLAGLLIAVYSKHGGGVADPLDLALGGPGSWSPVDELCSWTGPGAGLLCYVAPVAAGQGGEPGPWLGAVLLDLQPRQRAGARVRLEGGTLEVPLMDAYQAVGFVAGPTRLRVLESLAAAVRLQEGVVDPVTARRVRWLPPALPSELPADLLPAPRIRPQTDGRFLLELAVGPDQFRRWDPDLFRLDGRALGPATEISWTDRQGRVVTIPWPTGRGRRDDTCEPYAALGASGAGMLAILYEGPAPDAGSRLSAVLRDGRRAEMPVVLEPAPQAEPAESGVSLQAADSGRRLQLSPDLLVGSPNPFHAQTRISFQVPATVGEAFLLEESQEGLLDPQQRMPYADGAASVQVTVYSLEGRDLATLFVGTVGTGTYEAQWDGRDREGRTLASGTYFCKLQIEQWSVTRRLIFIR